MTILSVKDATNGFARDAAEVGRTDSRASIHLSASGNQNVAQAAHERLKDHLSSSQPMT
jgi:hypothetical protein